MLRSTTTSLSVPMCGLASTRIDAGAPKRCSVSRMTAILSCRLPQVSLPSLNVPAPPSPNWTFDSGSKTPDVQNFITARYRSSAGSPRSRTVTGMPASTSARAAKRPAGPVPTTATRAVRGAGGSRSSGPRAAGASDRRRGSGEARGERRLRRELHREVPEERGLLPGVERAAHEDEIGKAFGRDAEDARDEGDVHALRRAGAHAGEPIANGARHGPYCEAILQAG